MITTKTSDVLWQTLDKDGYDTTTVLILADCLEEEGSSDPLWDGLRHMVKQGYQPYYTSVYNEWWWLKPLQSEYPLIYKKCEVTLEIFDHIDGKSLDGKYPADLAHFDTLSSAVKAYARAWATLDHK